MDRDVIIIGSGQGGVPLARAFAKAGRRTALIERGPIGGTCVNVGCTPSKTMVASARVAWLAGRAGEYGVSVGGPRVAMERVRDRKRRVVESFRSGSERRLDRDGVEVIGGEACFTGPHHVRIHGPGAERTLSAPLIVINTGGRPARLDVPGADSIDALDSTSIMELDRVPEHLLVVGGGYVGIEFAQMFRRFGARVTVVQSNAQLLPREDPDIAAALLEILVEDGIDVRLASRTTSFDRAPGGGIRAHVDSNGDGTSMEVSHVLFATGRVPNTDALDAASAGVDLVDEGFVRVDDRLATTAGGVYAIGDVKGGPAFTHISYDDYRILRANLIDGGDATVSGRPVPYVVFTDPELGRVGMTEREARAGGMAVRIARMPMSHVARALERDEPRGVMKVVVDAGTDRILGCAVLGIEGGEIMSALQVAMMGGLRYTALRDGIFAHPTLAESFNNLFHSFDD